MSKVPRKIIIEEYLKWINSDLSAIRPHIHPVHSTSYWNVVWWDEDVEKHLIENEIKYQIKELK